MVISVYNYNQRHIKFYYLTMIIRQKKNEVDERDGIQLSTKFQEKQKTILE